MGIYYIKNFQHHFLFFHSFFFHSMNHYYAIIYENLSHKSGANRKHRLDFQIK